MKCSISKANSTGTALLARTGYSAVILPLFPMYCSDQHSYAQKNGRKANDREMGNGTKPLVDRISSSSTGDLLTDFQLILFDSWNVSPDLIFHLLESTSFFFALSIAVSISCLCIKPPTTIFSTSTEPPLSVTHENRAKKVSL